MKNIKKFFAVLTVLTVALFTFEGCYTPSPLYGTWADNNGNQIKFISDGSFVATIKGSIEGQFSKYSGEWITLDNVLIFTYSSDSSPVSLVMNTEWDIRGAMLYLTWTTDNNTKILTLYHTAK